MTMKGEEYTMSYMKMEIGEKKWLKNNSGSWAQGFKWKEWL